MDYEKEYKDAMERAKKWGLTHKLCIEDIFPELSESEDERMKRIIMKFVWGYTNTPHSIINGDKSTLEYAKEVEAYLEKQKDLDKMIVVTPEVWDKAFTDAYENGKKDGEKQKAPKVDIDKLRRDLYQSGYNEGYQHGKEDAQKEQKSAEWSDYKDKVNIPYCSSEPEWSEEDKQWLSEVYSAINHSMYSEDERQAMKKYIDSLRSQPKQEWSEEDKGFLLDVKCVIDEVLHSTSDINTGYTKEELKEMWQWLDGIWQRVEYPEDKAEWGEKDEETLNNILYILNQLKDTTVHKEDKTAEKCISWLKSLKPQPKQEWSEEDEEMLNRCISSIDEAKENRYAYKETDGDTSYDEEIDWLKSLRPSWKPSEEQIYSLGTVVKGYNECTVGSVGYHLKEMYEQLKNL